MKNGFLVLAILLVLSYSQIVSGATPMAYFSSPGAAANDGIRIDFPQGCDKAGNGCLRRNSGSMADPAITLRSSEPGARNSDAGTAAFNGLNVTSAPGPGGLLLAGSALIAIGAALKKLQKNT